MKISRLNALASAAAAAAAYVVIIDNDVTSDVVVKYSL